jgi:hypothetical protein
MPVPNKMPALGARVDKSQSIDDVVQAAFKRDEKIGARDTLLTIGSFEEEAELIFREAIHPFDLLLFPELNTVVGRFPAPSLSMLTRRISTPIKCTFVRVATVPFQKQFQIFTSA